MFRSEAFLKGCLLETQCRYFLKNCFLKFSAPAWSRQELRFGRKKNRVGTRPVWKTCIYTVRRESGELRLERSMPCAPIQYHTVWALQCFSRPMGKIFFFFILGTVQVVRHIARQDVDPGISLPPKFLFSRDRYFLNNCNWPSLHTNS